MCVTVWAFQCRKRLFVYGTSDYVHDLLTTAGYYKLLTKLKLFPVLSLQIIE